MLHDLLPDEKLREVENLQDFAGMLVFDKSACNTNGRQTDFFADAARAEKAATGWVTPVVAEAGPGQRVVAQGTPTLGAVRVEDLCEEAQCGRT